MWLLELCNTVTTAFSQKKKSKPKRTEDEKQNKP